jgi:fibronectin type 3 domain-containing protein
MYTVTKLTFILGALLCIVAESVAQTRSVRIIAERNDSAISLRWAPTSPEIFELGKKNGYRIERTDLRNGTKTIVNEDRPIVHWSPGAWQWFLSQIKSPDSSRMMYMHIGFTMLFGDSLGGTPPQSMQEKQEASEYQYNYALLAADRDSVAAVGLGLRFEDWFIEPGVRYLYRISVLGGVSPNIINEDTVTVEGMPARRSVDASLRADELDGEIALHWNQSNHFTAYMVERSENNGATFRSMNDAPMVTLITGDTIPSGIEHFNDTTVTNYRVYIYRVYGYNSFGSKILLGSVKAMPRDRTPPDMPTEVHADNVAPQKVKITWQMHEPIPRDLAGFHIGKDTVDQGDPPLFPHITKTMLPPSAREFTDETGVFARKNYYVVDAYDTAGNMMRSFSAYCVMIDSTPPSPPVLVRGVADTNGIVRIEFKRPPEQDYMGYRLLFANDTTHEFSVIRERFSNDSMSVAGESVVIDTVEIRTLTRNVYYRMYALDFNYNESQWSNLLTVVRPDLVPPVAPVITGYEVTDSAVMFEIVPSSSEDVKYHRLLRKLSSTDRWDSIAVLTASANNYIDRTGGINAEYDYTIEAVDEAGLRSEQSNIITARRYDTGVRDTVRNVRARFDAAARNVTLEWEYNDNGEQVSYLIYRGDAAEITSYSLVKDRTRRAFTDTSLPTGSSIRYAVKVIAASGAESRLTTPVTVTIR